MKTKNTDSRATASKLMQGLYSMFSKSDDKTRGVISEAIEEIDNYQDLWHKDSRGVPSEREVPTGRPVDASGKDSIEFSEHNRDGSEQVGISKEYEEFSDKLAKEIAKKAYVAFMNHIGKSMGKTVDWSAEGMDENEAEKSEEEDEQETSKGMPSASVAELMGMVAGRRDGQDFRTPPHFAKARGNAFEDLARQIDELPLAKSLAASTLLNQAKCVAEGTLPEQVFAHWLSEAEPEIRAMFSEFDRDPSVRKWVF